METNKRLTFNLKKSYDNYYLNDPGTVYGSGKTPKSEYISPYKKDMYIPEHNVKREDAYYKLGQLEDIEEELGIDLVTLFKALKGNDFYSKHPETGEVSWIPLPRLYYCSRKWNIGCHSTIFNEQEKCCDSWDCDPKDYGKTWALTKEELV